MLMFIAEMSDCLGVATQFQLLNGADPVIIGLNHKGDDSLEVFITFLAITFWQYVLCNSFFEKSWPRSQRDKRPFARTSVPW